METMMLSWKFLRPITLVRAPMFLVISMGWDLLMSSDVIVIPISEHVNHFHLFEFDRLIRFETLDKSCAHIVWGRPDLIQGLSSEFNGLIQWGNAAVL